MAHSISTRSPPRPSESESPRDRLLAIYLSLAALVSRREAQPASQQPVMIDSAWCDFCLRVFGNVEHDWWAGGVITIKTRGFLILFRLFFVCFDEAWYLPPVTQLLRWKIV